MQNPTEFIKNKVNDIKDQVLSKAEEYRAQLDDSKAQDTQEENTEEYQAGEEDLDSDVSGDEEISSDEERELSADQKRENLKRNFELKEPTLEDIEQSKQTSQLSSQGVADHSGSPVHGAGRNMDGKSNSSMWQRNFNNHQGN